MRCDYYFALAASFASRRVDCRSFLVGAVGLRNDGVLVMARNSSAYDKTPDVHAESRLVHKLTPGSTVYVARWLRSSGLALAKPCRSCEAKMRARGIKRVYYTISDNEFGTIKM